MDINRIAILPLFFLVTIVRGEVREQSPAFRPDRPSFHHPLPYLFPYLFPGHKFPGFTITQALAPPIPIPIISPLNIPPLGLSRPISPLELEDIETLSAFHFPHISPRDKEQQLEVEDHVQPHFQLERDNDKIVIVFRNPENVSPQLVNALNATLSRYFGKDRSPTNKGSTKAKWGKGNNNKGQSQKVELDGSKLEMTTPVPLLATILNPPSWLRPTKWPAFIQRLLSRPQHKEGKAELVGKKDELCVVESDHAPCTNLCTNNGFQAGGTCIQNQGCLCSINAEMGFVFKGSLLEEQEEIEPPF